MPDPRSGQWVRLAVLTLAAVAAGAAGWRMARSDAPLDPAAWGGDHADKPVPEYVTGDECLFCHRQKIGTTWSANRHQLTMRPFEDHPAAAELIKQGPDGLNNSIKYVLGHEQRQRFLKPSGAYGKLDLLSVGWTPPHDGKPGRLDSTDKPTWDSDRFADACAGCHATAVDPKEKSFSALSLDCYVCHGVAPTEHPNKPELVYLSPRRKDPARVVVSICAQCHIRTGKSKSTSRPYPTNFVAGDNLFRDFQIDFSEQAMSGLSAADRHVLENVRDVVVLGREGTTCLSCHDVHGRSSKKHHLVGNSDYCTICHNADGPKRVRKPLTSQSKTCGY